MAPTATVYNFEIDLADNDRQVYEHLKLTVAMHPSETHEYLVARLLAFCLEYQERICFSKGLAEPEEPALWAHSLDGQLLLWVEVGLPGVEKIHKANKLAKRVAIYTHRDPNIVLDQLMNKQIYRASLVPVYNFSGNLLSDFVSILEKRIKLSITINEQVLYIESNQRNLDCLIEKRMLS